MVLEGRVGAKKYRKMREAQEEIERDDTGHDGTGVATGNGDIIPLEEIEGGRKHAPLRNPGVASSRVHRWTEACFRAGVCVDFSGRVGRPESDCDNCFGSSTCEIFQIISLCIC